jgi:SAM domain (Sterile alpha motif)
MRPSNWCGHDTRLKAFIASLAAVGKRFMTSEERRPPPGFQKRVKDRPLPLDLRELCEALRTPTLPLDTLASPTDDAHTAPDCRRPSWTLWSGCGAWAAFRENDIDETVLPSLTHETLKDLGVTSVGHRVKLLDAIAALRNDGSGKAPSIDTGTKSSTPSGPPADRAERRQVTVMFSDLVGSTALSGPPRGHFGLPEVRP